MQIPTAIKAQQTAHVLQTQTGGVRLAFAQLGLGSIGAQKIAAYFRKHASNPFPVDGKSTPPISLRWVDDAPTFGRITPLHRELADKTSRRMGALTQPLREHLARKGYDAVFSMAYDSRNGGFDFQVVLTRKSA